VCVWNSGATRLHFLIPLTETPFKRLARQNASQHGSQYEVPVSGAQHGTVADSSTPDLDISEQAFLNSVSRSKLASREPSAEF